MNRSIEAIPTWSLCYIINGDASGLTDEEIRMVDEAMRKNNIEIVSPRYNEDMCTEPYFSRYPFFGLPTEVEDCDIIYHEYTQEGNKLTEDQQWAKIALVQSIAKDVWGE